MLCNEEKTEEREKHFSESSPKIEKSFFLFLRLLLFVVAFALFLLLFCLGFRLFVVLVFPPSVDLLFFVFVSPLLDCRFVFPSKSWFGLKPLYSSGKNSFDFFYSH
jgi:hypothetical protein